MKPQDDPYSNQQNNQLQLTQEQIEQINNALASVKEFGEVHLIIQRGVLKYINVLNSHKAWDDEFLKDE